MAAYEARDGRMTRRGVAVATGVAAAVGAGTSPGAGAEGVADVVGAAVPAGRVAVEDAPTTALPGAAAGTVPVGDAVGAPGAVAVTEGDGAGAAGAGEALRGRSVSISAAESRAAASRARRDSSARTTPSQEPANTATEVAATNRLTRVRRTIAPRHSSLRHQPNHGYGGMPVWRPPSLRFPGTTIPSRIPFGTGLESDGCTL